ncbi:hypothetical protein ACNQGB_00910 [Flavobacterium sp. XS1P32]|uniref:hypothetical protein n=1 Tax=Flavobacterium sp. XS1P32 TaxID=3401726 RepID=UPI003AAD8D96
MGKVKLNHEHPAVKDERYIEEVKQLSYQQRFEKLIAIIELSHVLKLAKKANNRLNIK